MGDDRTPDMALLPGERAMSEAEWAEYGGLPPTLRAYCHRLLRDEAEAQRLRRLDALELAEWRLRAERMLDRMSIAQQRAVALADEVARLRKVAARAEAAEQRAEALAAEVARLRTERERAQVDACLMLSLAWVTDAPRLIGACSANGASTAEIVALRGLCEKTIAADRPGDLLAAIRRVLHHEGTAVRGSAACVAAVVAGRPAGEVADPVTP